MQKIVGLMGANQNGPWICTAGLKNPHVMVKGFGEYLSVQMQHSPEDGMVAEHRVIEADGLHKLRPAAFMKITQSGSKSILCILQSD